MHGPRVRGSGESPERPRPLAYLVGSTFHVGSSSWGGGSLVNGALGISVPLVVLNASESPLGSSQVSHTLGRVSAGFAAFLPVVTMPRRADYALGGDCSACP